MSFLRDYTWKKVKEYYKPLHLNLIIGDRGYRYKPDEKLSAHDMVIRPLFLNSLNTFVFGMKEDNELLKSNQDILIKEKGKYKLDKTKECVNGHENLWNSTTWKRGSIVMILTKDFDFAEIFRHCHFPGIVENPNSGNSLSATKKCRDEAALGNIGICFSASNGIEWMQIYTDIKHRDALYDLAHTSSQESD